MVLILSLRSALFTGKYPVNAKHCPLSPLDISAIISDDGPLSVSRRLKETVAEIPLTSIVLETDCPYLAPEPNRGKRNSSLNLVYVAREIARIKDVPYDEVVACTARNARALYRLDR